MGDSAGTQDISILPPHFMDWIEIHFLFLKICEMSFEMVRETRTKEEE
jgi:hypothetical protein